MAKNITLIDTETNEKVYPTANVNNLVDSKGNQAVLNQSFKNVTTLPDLIDFYYKQNRIYNMSNELYFMGKIGATVTKNENIKLTRDIYHTFIYEDNIYMLDKTTLSKYNIKTKTYSQKENSILYDDFRNFNIRIGTNVYYYSGNGQVNKLDLTTDTFTTLQTTGAKPREAFCCDVAYGKYIYIFGPNTGTGWFHEEIYKLDTETLVIEKIGVLKERVSYGFVFENNIYACSNKGIFRFNPLTNEIEKIFPLTQFGDCQPYSIGPNIYTADSKTKGVYKISILNGNFEDLGVSISQGFSDSILVANGNLFMIGGKYYEGFSKFYQNNIEINLTSTYFWNKITSTKVE